MTKLALVLVFLPVDVKIPLSFQTPTVLWFDTLQRINDLD